MARLISKWSLAACTCLAIPAIASAQQNSQLERGADGRMYRVTRQTVNRTVPVTEYQTREEKVYRPRTTTEYREVASSQITPVTEYRWVSRQRGLLNPFVPTYWSHQLEPFTRWESRPTTVQMPTTRTDWVEQRRTVQVPVTTYRTVQEEVTQRYAVSAPPTSLPAGGRAIAVASRPTEPLRWGGRRLDSDPPRTASPYR